ncbi:MULTISPECIES: TetR family transcriptional regulator [unclassified Arthrobacter]|uniref:TetR family transcriptional regulator n=1 Tax=unclassified Arthrobacter TaxID=235627 RepID=UPI001C855EF1|nr:TetR family transcriptional regulator [Arthrobacter sp. MAHUQ-56]MBX7443907.1 TetR/AcrR family transcriptional regulator; helix-turn-helix transcriptional regulator [Arthrobacter sp. MAHUQ-56]
MTANAEGRNADEPVAAAIGLLARQGFDATSVEGLAEAAGMSRSTFFRKFGSKEDVVFADHERILGHVNALLAGSTRDPLAAVCDAALLVFNHHLRNPETSRARYRLLQAVPALRDRELVTSHRYERAFLRHVMDGLPDGGAHEHTAVAFAASVVAVHNAFLREWLRSGPEAAEDAAAGAPDAAPGDRQRAASLATELHALSRMFRPVLLGRGRAPQPPTVVVTVLADAVDKEAIAQAVRDALP